MDCGPGTAGQIALHLPPEHLTAVAISHFHPDHYFDLVALYYLLKFGPSRPGRLPVWVPPGGRQFLDRLGQLIADKPQMLEDVFDLCEYPLGSPVMIGGLELTFIAVKHYVPSHAMRVCGSGGGVLTFSSDVAPCDALPVAARGADLFMCESALLTASQDDPDPAKRGHMSAVEAGQAATAAGARRLLITHYRSSPEDDAHHLAAARGAFSGPVELAKPGATYTV
jgi:ribonuclease BN (tRNA processing enzyme)